MRFILILMLFSSILLGQNSDVFGHLREGSYIITTLVDHETKKINSPILEKLNESLIASNLKQSSDKHVSIGNYKLQIDEVSQNYLFKSTDKLVSLYIEEFKSKKELDDKFKLFTKWKGAYGGYESYNSAYYYLKLDTLQNVSLNATFKTGNHIINLQQRLPFFQTDFYLLSEKEWKIIDQSNTYLINVLIKLCENLVNEKDKMYLPSNGRISQRVFTSTERIAGFVNFWTEVKYNFAFFDHVPNIIWDEILNTYLPLIEAPQTNAE